MKRLISATSNKPKSLEKAAMRFNERNTLGYVAVANHTNNAVDVYDSSGTLVEEYKLRKELKNIKRSGFREATQEDIDRGAKLYVRKSYDATTYKQVPEFELITEVLDRYYLY